MILRSCLSRYAPQAKPQILAAEIVIVVKNTRTSYQPPVPFKIVMIPRIALTTTETIKE
jgi:hypothetical protein